MIEQINWNEGDKRVGRKNTPVGTQWPELDVFGNEYSQPASTVVNDVDPNSFVVIPSREIKPDEWTAIKESFNTTPPPVPAADPTPNYSESNRPAWADQSVILPPPDFESLDVSAPDQPTPVELAAPDEGKPADFAPDAGNVNETPSESQTRKRNSFR